MSQLPWLLSGWLGHTKLLSSIKYRWQSVYSSATVAIIRDYLYMILPNTISSIAIAMIALIMFIERSNTRIFITFVAWHR
jgi:hypothetical protein